MHIICNIGAIRAMRFKSFNQARLLYCLNHFLKTGKVPSIEKANRKECIVIGFGITAKDVCKFKLRLGVSIKQALKFVRLNKHELKTVVKLDKLINHFKEKPFLIVVKPEERNIDIILQECILPAETIEAYVRSILIAHRYISNKALFDALDKEITEDWKLFKKLAEKEGFDFTQEQLGANDWRMQIGNDQKDTTILY